jgi:hypothetical protein
MKLLKTSPKLEMMIVLREFLNNKKNINYETVSKKSIIHSLLNGFYLAKKETSNQNLKWCDFFTFMRLISHISNIYSTQYDLKDLKNIYSKWK